MTTPRIDAVLATIRAQIDRAPTSGPVTMEHIEMIGAWIQAIGEEGKNLERQLAEVSERYNELLYAVAQKFPGESRHETALRYIREAERHDGEAGSCKQNAEGHGRAVARTVDPLVRGEVSNG